MQQKRKKFSGLLSFEFQSNSLFRTKNNYIIDFYVELQNPYRSEDSSRNDTRLKKRDVCDGISKFRKHAFLIVHLTTNFCPMNFTFRVDRDYCYCVLL